MAEKLKVVIIGGVAAGMKTAAKLRRCAPHSVITVVERGNLTSYGSCGMPYYVSGEIADIKSLMSTPTGVVRNEQFFKNVKNIDVLIGKEALVIDRSVKKVRIRDVQTGEESELPYDKLVIATGASPVVPPIEGINLHNVFKLWHPDDAVKMRHMLDTRQVKNAVIIGAGLIGLEVCEALVRHGVNVSVVEMKERILPALLDFEMAAPVQKHLEQQGVKIYTSERVVQINGQEAVQSVTTDKQEIEADLVLLAVGAKPNAELAKQAGLAIGETGGIKVNEFLETSDPDIYAGGDCVENINLITQKPIYAPMGSTANKHGRVIGENLCGRTSRFKGVLGTAVVKVIDMNVARTGLTEEQAKQLGYEYITVLSPGTDRAHYYPAHKPITVKMIVDVQTGKLLGAQVVGQGQVDKRIDIIVTAITLGAGLEDISNLDLAYAPPFNAPIDNVAVAANIALNKLTNVVGSATPMEVKRKLEENDDFILLDVRAPEEFAQVCLGEECQLVPLGKLRSKLDELPKDKEIIAYCKLSARGYEAALVLQGAGFKQAKFMDGGIEAWPYRVCVKQP